MYSMSIITCIHVYAEKDVIKCACTGVHMYMYVSCIVYQPGYQFLLHIHLEIHVPTGVYLRVHVCV